MSAHHTNPGAHQRLPATPAEIRRVLVVMESLSRMMAGEADVPPLDSETAAVLHGLVLGFEGTVFPIPDDIGGDIGYRVAQSLTRGGSPWL